MYTRCTPRGGEREAKKRGWQLAFKKAKKHFKLEAFFLDLAKALQKRDTKQKLIQTFARAPSVIAQVPFMFASSPSNRLLWVLAVTSSFLHELALQGLPNLEFW